MVTDVEKISATIDMVAVLERASVALSDELKEMYPGSFLRIWVQKQNTNKEDTDLPNAYLRFRRTSEFPSVNDMMSMAMLESNKRLAQVIKLMLLVNTTYRVWRVQQVQFMEMKEHLTNSALIENTN
jgi:hypothetical protein